ncbi:MAG: HAD hydrolase-like protein [Candidatus Latescibacteria bacterium]|jgi:phosphoglycolate phosphatase|nr:HAD hydrolase-like protein [Candidatus Latescibacterota bacterium]
MHPVTTIMFDLDGTLTDPKEGISRCIQHALIQLDAPPAPSRALEAAIGPPLRQTFALLLNTDRADLIEQAMVCYRERFVEVGMYENAVYLGIVAMLETLSPTYRLLLATSKPRVYAAAIVTHFGLAQYLDGIYGSELDGHLDQKTDLLRHIIEIEQLRPVEATMVGDRHHDMVGAKNNGCQAIGVTYGYGSEAELLNAGADHICQTPQDISEFFAA